MDDAELIVEATAERPDAKRALYAELGGVAPPGTIWASNTSHLDVVPLIPERRQRRAMIAHWHAPPYIVLRKSVPGYVADRVQAAIQGEVQRLLDEGVSTVQEVDAAIIDGITLRLPILGVFARPIS